MRFASERSLPAIAPCSGVPDPLGGVFGTHSLRVLKELGNTRPGVKGRGSRRDATGGVFVFFRVEEPGLPPYAGQLAAFKVENAVGPHDTLVEVTLTFDAPSRAPIHEIV